MNKLLKKWNAIPNSVKSSIFFAFSAFLIKGISFLVTPIFTRIMRIEDYGVITTYNSWVSIIEIFALLGLTSAGVFNVGLKDNKKTRDMYISNCLGLCNICTLIVFAIIIILKYIYGDNFWLNNDLIVVMFIHFLFNPALIFWITRQKYEYKYKLATFVTICSTILGQALSLVGVLQFKENAAFVKILGNEMEFKDGKQYPPIIMELENGEKVEITGKIDRVDIAIADDKKYVRIIDYKSSVKNIDLNKVINGLQIQLVTYLDSITKIEDVLPAGVMYFNLIEPMVKEKKNLKEEEIEQKIRSQFKMKGLILADVKIVRMMDNRLQTGSSDIVAAEISSKSESLLDRTGNPITDEDFRNLQKQVRKTIKEISTEILKGKIDIKPFKNGKKTACDYCQYKAICRFNTNIKGNEYLKIEKKNKKEILEEIAKI